ncbi:MAG: ZIP family metal transporter [Nitrospirae bacterium]|nr:ZIP family metal transporter [Nitrospirota bacterium]
MSLSLARLSLYTILIMISVAMGLALLRRRPGTRWRTRSLSLSAGVFLGLTFFHIVPEVFDSLAAKAGLFFIAGFSLIYVLERFFMVHPCEEPDCETHVLGYPAFVGLSIHSFSDGLALGSSMMLPATGLGFAVFLGILAHHAPQAFSLTSLLLREHFTWTKVVWTNLLFVAMIPLGAVAAGIPSDLAGAALLPALLAFSGGIFLHIGISDLIPEIHEAKDSRALHIFLFLAGLVMMGGVRLLRS